MNSLRSKTVIIWGVAVVTIIILLLLASRFILLERFEDLEQDSVQANMVRLRGIIIDEIAATAAITGDWSQWTETHLFVQGENPEYVDDNLSYLTLETLNVNLMLYTDATDQIYYSISADLVNGEIIDLPIGVDTYLEPGSTLLSHPDESSIVSGFLLLPESPPMLVTSRPITDNNDENMGVGSVIVGRFWDDVRLEELAETSQLSLMFYHFDDAGLPADFVTAKDELSTVSPIFITQLDNDTIGGYTVLEDIDGNPALLIRADMPREIYSQGRDTVVFFLAALVGAGVVIVLAVLLMLNRLVLARLFKISEKVADIAATSNFAGRITTDGEDELTELGGAINTMLEALEKSQKEASKTNQALTTANARLVVAREEAVSANRVKSQFLSTMSHELRTPLNAIIGYTEIQLAGMVGELGEKQKNYQERVLANSLNLLQLINSVLDISKIEAGRMEIVKKPFNVRNWLTEITSQNRVLVEQKGLTLEVEVDAALPDVVIGDSARIKQVTVNLLSNAIKFTEAGKIRVEMAKGAANTWKLIVSDTGIGIPAHKQETVFEEFAQVDGGSNRGHGGSGLGLAIVRRLIVMMGGSVRLSSKPGEGSTFTVTLPLETEAVPAAVQP